METKSTRMAVYISKQRRCGFHYNELIKELMEVYRDKESRNWSILYSERRENVEWENMEVGESGNQVLGNMRMDRICGIRNRMKKLLIKQKLRNI